MKEWLNIMELAEKTKIPDTTIRRYITKFSQFFLHRGGTRSRRYESSAAEVLLRIKDLYEGGYESEEVANALGKEFPVVVDGEPAEKKPEKADMTANITAEDVAEIKHALAEQKEFNKLLIQRLADQDRFIKESLEQRDQLLLERLSEKEGEKESQEEQKEVAAVPAEKKGFFKKFFK